MENGEDNRKNITIATLFWVLRYQQPTDVQSKGYFCY